MTNTRKLQKTTFKKGLIPWNKGKKLSDEGKKKLSLAHKGQVAWNKGIKQWKGKIHPRLGKKHTTESKEKISISRSGKGIGNTKGFVKNHIPWNLGKTFTNEVKKKMSMARIGKYTSDYYAKLGAISVAKQDGIKEPTSIEKKVYQELKDRGLLFETQKLINNKFVVDAYIPSLNLVIEADGNYWHSLPKNITRDKVKNAYLNACGFNLLRLTETEINNGNFKNKLQEVLN